MSVLNYECCDMCAEYTREEARQELIDRVPWPGPINDTEAYHALTAVLIERLRGAKRLDREQIASLLALIDAADDLRVWAERQGRRPR